MRILVDAERLTENIVWFHRSVEAHGLVVRAHVKGHRLTEVTTQQLAAGAVGIIAQTAREARHHVAQTGVRSVVIARPHTDLWRLRAYAAAFAELDALGATVVLQLPDLEAVDTLAHEAERTGSRFAVRLEVEAGAERGFGTDAEVVAAARRVAESPALVLDGVAGYFSPATPAQTLSWAHLSRASARRLVDAAGAVRDDGIDCGTVSVGGTVNGLYACGVPGVTEVSAGAYALGDAVVAARTGCVPALTVHGREAEPDLLDLLAGTSNDWDETVTATTASLEPVDLRALPSGDEVVLVPAHICPLVMQPGQFEVTGGDAGTQARWAPVLLPELQP